MLYNYLLNRKIDVVLTREIGGTPASEKIRDLIFSTDLCDMTELLLIMAARYEHVENVIRPALLQGKWVVCDRFIDSTLSYQGGAIGIDLILKLHQDTFGDFMPDLTFFIDLDPQLSLDRALQRGDSNKFEEKSESFHSNIYNNFLLLSQRFTDRIITVDGMQDINSVHQSIVKRLCELIDHDLNPR